MKQLFYEHWDTILISVIAVIAFVVVFINKERKARNK